jgi:tellurite resistance protein
VRALRSGTSRHYDGDAVSRIDQLRTAFGVIHILPMTREDADAILELAQLVVDIDGGEDSDEIKLFFAVGKVLFELAEAPDATIPTFASDQDDDERLFELATQLRSRETRELAFVVARVLAEADLEIVAEEETFIERLRSLLSIGKERANELDTILRSA